MPVFRLAAFTAASLDWLLAHPLGQGALLGAAALVVWTCARGIRRAARRRAVRGEMLHLIAKYPPRRK